MEDPIIVVDYDANWSSLYEQEKIQILKISCKSGSMI